MSKPAFIIDGFTEKIIIQKVCPGHPVSRTDLNGKGVSLDAMARKISSLIRAFGNKYYPIIILVDKEQRRMPCQQMSQELYEKIREQGVKDDIIVGVADRMLENWIIADWEKLETDQRKPPRTDACSPLGYIKKCRGTYNKTTDGVELFLQARPSVIYQYSDSFKIFVDSLDGINCQFLEFER